MKKRNCKIAVFVPHKGCPHDCVFCNQRRITGQIDEMTVDKARLIIENSLESIERFSDADTYVEIAFFGGSFTAIDIEKQNALLNLASEYYKSGRVNGIRCSTRPDAISEEILDNVLRYSMTAIELGVQSCDDAVLAKCERGHSFDDVIKASELIRERGISLGLQMMTGLPGDTREKCIRTAYEIADLRPDCVRIYPTLVMDGTRLKDMYNSGEYMPQTLEEAVELVADIVPVFENANIEIMRIGLQTTDNVNSETVIGPYHPAFAELCYGRIELNKIKNYMDSNNFSGGVLKVSAPKNKFSKIIGHRRENANYLKREYNTEVVLNESEVYLIEFNKK